jgi:hypothetical protein
MLTANAEQGHQELSIVAHSSSDCGCLVPFSPDSSQVRRSHDSYLVQEIAPLQVAMSSKAKASCTLYNKNRFK